jgi:hypothetical protein
MSCGAKSNLVRDEEVARRTGRTANAVRVKRRRAGIPAVS